MVKPGDSWVRLKTDISNIRKIPIFFNLWTIGLTLNTKLCLKMTFTPKKSVNKNQENVPKQMLLIRCKEYADFRQNWIQGMRTSIQKVSKM